MELGVSASVLVNEEDHLRKVKKTGRWFPRYKEGEWLRRDETNHDETYQPFLHRRTRRLYGEVMIGEYHQAK
jgi:hypothetical protein